MAILSKVKSGRGLMQESILENDLELSEASLLLLTLLRAHLQANVKFGHEILSSTLSSTIIRNWLDRNNLKAGISYCIEMSLLGDALFLSLRRNAGFRSLSLAQVLAILEEASLNDANDTSKFGRTIKSLIEKCNMFVLEQGLA
jgi:hypothetical protein